MRSGDSVYTLVWDPQAGQPLLRTLDPAFFFPEWDDEVDAAEFPARVHLAWELPEDPRTGRKARLRRVTYELGSIGAATRPRTYPWAPGKPSQVTCCLTDLEWLLEVSVLCRAKPWWATMQPVAT
ncbi:hypothetical protein ACFVUN_27145 [Kitasatospora griseola]|uniref:hypothetical protein n=1 Tax=Kitasatospora griseola TaxID=2064 RepID=UPI0036DE8C1E